MKINQQSLDGDSLNKQAVQIRIGPPVVVKEPSPYLFCDSCGFYPLEPVHGHFVCPQCKMPTKCCEAGPIPS